MSDLIRTDDVCLPATTIIYLTVAADALTIVSSEGYLTADCVHPRFPLRDYIAGEAFDFRKSARPQGGPFDLGLRTAAFSRSPPRQYRAPPLPDDVAARDGWFIVELRDRTDYHPWESAQIFGVNGQHLILGFASTTYQVFFLPGTDLRNELNQIVDGGRCCHLTVNQPGVFLNWLPAPRRHCLRIREIPDRPDTLGRLSPSVDFRDRPEHRAFQKKAARLAGPRGPAMDL